MRIVLVLPVLLPLLTAIMGLLLPRNRVLQRTIACIGVSLLLTSALVMLHFVRSRGILVTYIGNYPAPFGITFVADLFSALMVLLAATVGFAVTIYSLASVDARREQFGYYPLMSVLLTGVIGAFLTGDIFNMYVWFEVMLIASFVLIALGGEKEQLQAAIQYVVLNLLSSAFFLAAIGILYGSVGSLNMADIAVKLAASPDKGTVTTIAMLFLAAFGIKAAVFPLYFWLPSSYHVPPVAVSAVFAGLLTKVGVYALIRVFTLLFVHDVSYTHTVILWIAGFTMVSGILGAMSQNEFRKILSFHIVSQIGYMILGVALFTPFAVAGAVFYIAHHILVKTNLFLISGVANRLGGSFELKKLGGLYANAPFLSILFLIPAMSLAGMPPFSGFFAKLALLEAGFLQGRFFIVGVSLVVGLFTLYSMTKIWNEAFWKSDPIIGDAGVAVVGERRWVNTTLLYAPIVMLASLTLMIGFGAGTVFSLATAAANQLMHPAEYINAVLGTASQAAGGSR